MDGLIDMNKIIWFTGLISSGKTTIAERLYIIMQELGTPVALLDGDNVRRWISPDLGYSSRDRLIQMDRLYGVGKLLEENDIYSIICTNTSPTKRMDDVITIYIKCSMDECKKRDVKHLYAKYDKGEIKNLPGIDLKYTPPKSPFLTLETDKNSIDECVNILMDVIR